ncbi:MAG: hypothetical protein ABSD46_12555 [Bacteroidota bacterium]
MKLYSYSSELLTFVEAKWALAKLATSGILMGTVILFGAIKLNQSVGNALESRSANTLAAENNFLWQQVSLILPRVSKLEMQARQLNKCGNKLHMFLHRREIVGGHCFKFHECDHKVQAPIFDSAEKSFHP